MRRRRRRGGAPTSRLPPSWPRFYDANGALLRARRARPRAAGLRGRRHARTPKRARPRAAERLRAGEDVARVARGAGRPRAGAAARRAAAGAPSWPTTSGRRRCAPRSSWRPAAVSDPVRSAAGFHVLVLVAREPGRRAAAWPRSRTRCAPSGGGAAASARSAPSSTTLRAAPTLEVDRRCHDAARPCSPGPASVRSLARRAPARAHDRSVSYSTWTLEPTAAPTSPSASSALEASRLPWPVRRPARLGDYLSRHVSACWPATYPARRAGPPQPLATATGELAVRVARRCPERGAARRIESDVLLDVAPSHLHFAHVRRAGRREPSSACCRMAARRRRRRRARAAVAPRVRCASASSTSSRAGITSRSCSRCCSSAVGSATSRPRRHRLHRRAQPDAGARGARLGTTGAGAGRGADRPRRSRSSRPRTAGCAARRAARAAVGASPAGLLALAARGRRRRRVRARADARRARALHGLPHDAPGPRRTPRRVCAGRPPSPSASCTASASRRSLVDGRLSRPRRSRASCSASTSASSSGSSPSSRSRCRSCRWRAAWRPALLEVGSAAVAGLGVFWFVTRAFG